MEKKTIAVVLATYNGARFIREQIESLLNQSRAPDRIIISDDGSTDGTLEIIDHYARTNPNLFKIIKKGANLGFRDNFLQAALHAESDYIAFCDQDDIWDKRKLEICSKYFQDPSVALIVHSAKLVDKDGNELGDFSQGIKATKISPPLTYDPWSTFWGFSILFRRDLLKIFPLEERFLDYISPQHLIAHDRWVTFLGQVVGSTVEIRENLVSYRQHDRNIYGNRKSLTSFSKKQIEERSSTYIKATERMTQIVKSISIPPDYGFILYDREKSLEFFERALQQLVKRDSIYHSKTRFVAIAKIVVFIFQGVYRNTHNERLRWKSIAMDVRFALSLK
jgi:glycosyltransferase involved in cell wall biosynthesis